MKSMSEKKEIGNQSKIFFVTPKRDRSLHGPLKNGKSMKIIGLTRLNLPYFQVSLEEREAR